MAGRVEGKVAVVTGGASGIGRAVARRLAAEGARVVVGDVDAAGLADVEAELGATCVGALADVTDEDQVARLCAAAVEHFGRLDVAVANAGAGAYAPLLDQPLEAWRQVLDLCLTGVFLTVKHAGRRMSTGGSIVTIASMNAVQPAAGMSAYCTAKAGVVMLTQVAAMELGPSGIRVNAIAPGLVQTNATSALFAVPAIVEDFVANTTVGRFATPDDVANVALFLASDESSFVSASVYAVDGGAVTGRYPDLPGHLARLTEQQPEP